MDDKSFEIFVRQDDSLSDGWSKPLTAEQASTKIKTLISNKLNGAIIAIPVDIMAQFKDMHICFPGVVCSVENDSSTYALDGWFEYIECEDGGTWKIKVTWSGDRHRKRITLEEITDDVVNALTRFTAAIKITIDGVKQSPPIEEINKKMWGLVRC